MGKRALGRIGAATVLMAGAVGLAGPAAAATPTWPMPDVKGLILQKAHDAIAEATGGAVVEQTSDADGLPYEQINLTDWVVCSQSPSAGKKISVKRPPELQVARPNACPSSK